MAGFGRRTFMVPIPEATDIDALNAMLLERCQARQDAVLRGADVTIGERLAADRAAFPALPPTPFDACDKRPGKASSQPLMRCKSTDYSVPIAYAHRDVLVKGYGSDLGRRRGDRPPPARHRAGHLPARREDPLPTAAAIGHEMIEAQDEKRLMRLQKALAGYELLNIDELGFVPLSRTGAELPFELMYRPRIVRHRFGTTRPWARRPSGRA